MTGFELCSLVSFPGLHGMKFESLLTFVFSTCNQLTERDFCGSAVMQETRGHTLPVNR